MTAAVEFAGRDKRLAISAAAAAAAATATAAAAATTLHLEVVVGRLVGGGGYDDVRRCRIEETPRRSSALI